MRVPLLDLRPQLADVEAELKAAVLEVVESTRYVMGPKVELFEAAAADYVGCRYAIGVSSGTDALLASHALRWPAWTWALLGAPPLAALGVIAHAGNGVLSRIKPHRVSNHRLPPGNGRGAIMLEFGDGPDALVVCSVHLALSRRIRTRQLDFITELSGVAA